MKIEILNNAKKEISKMKISELNDERIIESLGQLKDAINDVFKATKVLYIHKREK